MSVAQTALVAVLLTSFCAEKVARYMAGICNIWLFGTAVQTVRALAILEILQFCSCIALLTSAKT